MRNVVPREKGDFMYESRLPVKPMLRHFGLYVFDVDAMVEFYVEMLGLVVTDRGVSSLGIPVVFLSGDRAQHHQLVLAAGRAPGSPSTVNQMAFQVGSLSNLLDYGGFLKERGVTPARVLDHGNAWSIYFGDPEDNRVEVYTDSPWYYPQPCGVPLDLDRAEAEILAATAAMVRSNPAAMPVKEWQDRFGGQSGSARQEHADQ